MAVAPVRSLLAAACAELADDLGELAWVAGDQAERAASGDGWRLLAELRREALADAGELAALADAIRDTPSRGSLRRTTARRVELAHAIRRRQAVLAGALVAASWQSPSIRHARCSQSGPADGRVTAHRDDYARDRHPAGIAYERALAAIRAPGCTALLTTCGMSAVVVALAYVDCEPVLVGASAYHETRDLVRRASPHAPCVAEHPEEAFGAAIERLRPACVIVDAVATEEGVAVPDIAGIATRLAAARSGTWLVVDVTGAPLAVDLFALPEVRCGLLRVLAIESLTKHAQLGLDRVTAGAIYAAHDDAPALDVLREHLGANIADASVHALPTPHRAVLARRLARLARNAGALAGRMADAAPPGVVAYRMPATWLSLRLGTPERAAAFVDAALAHARARGSALVEGASFGLDATRVYAPSPGEAESCGFVRISAGIEHAEALERLARVLVRALREAYYAPGVSSPEAFESLVRDALDSLPGWLAPYLARISVQIDERPPPGEGDVYAFFDGPALGDDPVGQLPPVITLFRRPLVDDFGHDPAVLRREVQITVAHELAHLFGFGEERLEELGYG